MKAQPTILRTIFKLEPSSCPVGLTKLHRRHSDFRVGPTNCRRTRPYPITTVGLCITMACINAVGSNFTILLLLLITEKKYKCRWLTQITLPKTHQHKLKSPISEPQIKTLNQARPQCIALSLPPNLATQLRLTVGLLSFFPSNSSTPSLVSQVLNPVVRSETKPFQIPKNPTATPFNPMATANDLLKAGPASTSSSSPTPRCTSPLPLPTSTSSTPPSSQVSI